MRKLGVLILLVSVMFAVATKVIKEDRNKIVIKVTNSYVLGDNDTRTQAREIVLRQAKMYASEYAGSYVESNLVIENDKVLKEQIKTITMALISIKPIKERYTMTKDMRTKLTITTKATLDKKSFIKKVNRLKNSKKLQKTIASLEEKNKKLINRLKELNRLLKSGKRVNTNNSMEFLKERDEVLSQLDENENVVRKVFKRGTLFSMALKSGNEYKEAIRDIDKNVFEYIKNNLKITMDDPRFRDNGDGTYDIEILLHWKIEPDIILKTLNKYFWDNKQSPIKIEEYENPSIEINQFYNEKNKKKLAYSDKLYNHIKKIDITIKITAENYNSYLKIGAIDHRFFGCDGYCYKIEINNLTIPNKAYFGNNPVVIKNVPKSVLENLTTIETKVEVVNSKK